MTSPILITGGTGTLGRLLVPRLRDATGGVRVLTRRPPAASDGIEYVAGDLDTGDGIDAAVAGVATIVHCAGAQKGDGEKTRTLIRAAARAGAPHIVFISVVGADRIPVKSVVDRAMFGYFASKRAAEAEVSGSGLPWTTLRTTQFHDLVLTAVRPLVKLPIVPVPSGVRFQPVDAAEVADRLAELALGAPAGLVDDLAGPRMYAMADLVRSYLRATRRRRLLVPMPMAGAAARAVRSGANLAPDHADGRRTWEEFLAERVG